MNNVIQVQDVTKIYGKQTVLDHVCFSCEAGKIYGLVGRNGSGKTVLLKCICGFVHPDSGTVHVWGKQVGKDLDFPEDIGFLIESPGFLPNESALANLRHLASIRGMASLAEVRNSLEVVELDPDSRKHVGKFSMGMKQRLGIAQALMEKPHLLVLDEPMNGLDNKGVVLIRQVLKEFQRNGGTILLASHFQEDIAYLCDEVYQMDAGRLEKRAD